MLAGAGSWAFVVGTEEANMSVDEPERVRADEIALEGPVG